MKLYKIVTKGLGTHYAVAKDASAAYDLMRGQWDDADYGFKREREMETIELIAEAVEYPDCGVRLWGVEETKPYTPTSAEGGANDR